MAVGDPGSGILDPSNPLSFAFGGSSGPLGYNELQRRRAIAQALASQKRAFPKNIGEGLTSLGEAVGDRMTDARLASAERGYTGDRATNPLLAPPGAPPPARPPVATSDAADPLTAKNNIAALITPGGPGVPQPNPTLPGSETPTTTDTPAPNLGGLPSDAPTWGARSHAIGGIETGGTKDPYRTVGKANTKYGNALGKYGVMTANVAPWTQAALGQPLTPEQFLADDKAQDAVFKHRFGQYVARFGEEGAARAWFGGPGNVNKTHLTDAYERLSIGDYGKDYLKRLQGTQTATSGAPPTGDDAGATTTIDTAENPPTPTDIKPMVLAQANIPGALTPPSAVPPPPSVGRTTTDPRFKISPDDPIPPMRDERLTPEETRGWQILNHPRYAGDPAAHEIAKNLIEFGKAKRDANYTRAVEEYKLKYGTREKEALATSAYERDRPKTDLELRKGEQELATKQREEVDRQRLGGIAPEVFTRAIEKSHEKVQAIPAATSSIASARRNLQEGKMFTGMDADVQLSAAKAKAALGFPPDPRIAATEQFKSDMAPIIAAARSSLVGNANISNADLAAATQAAAGDIKLDRNSIMNVLNQIEKNNINEAIEHQRKVNTFAGNDPDRQRNMASFRLPMERIVPDWAVQRLRENADNEQAHKDFDEKYHTPGLSQRVLQYRR